MKEKTKLLKILLVSVRADYGGGPEYVYHLVQFLPSDVESFIACPREEPYWQRFAQQVGEENMVEIPHRRFTLSSLFSLLIFVRINHINLIHSSGKGAGLYGRILGMITGIPCVHTFHGVHIGTYNKFEKWLYSILENWLSVFSKRIIAVSNSEAEVIKKMKMCKPDKLVTIDNGVRIPPIAIKRRNLTSSKLKVISMSRFDYQKNSELIIPIIKNLRTLGRADEFEFNFLGSGTQLDDLKTELQRSNLLKYVVFHGSIPNPGNCLEKSFCYLSTSRWEGMPLAMLEAMSFGLPVVATNVVGNKDIVDHNKTGFLFELESPHVAAEYLIKLADDERLWEEFSLAARASVVEKHSVQRMVSETEQIYWLAVQ